MSNESIRGNGFFIPRYYVYQKDTLIGKGYHHLDEAIREAKSEVMPASVICTVAAGFGTTIRGNRDTVYTRVKKHLRTGRFIVWMKRKKKRSNGPMPILSIWRMERGYGTTGILKYWKVERRAGIRSPSAPWGQNIRFLGRRTLQRS